MFCGKCGVQNLNNTRFCVKCGAPASVVPAVAIAHPTQYAYRKPFPYIKVIAFLLVLAVVVTVLFLTFNKSDEDRIIDRLKSFESAYNEGNFDKLVGCFDQKTQTTFKSAAGVASSWLGINVGDMFGLIMGIGPAFTPGDTTIYVTAHKDDIEFFSNTEARVDLTFEFMNSKDDITFFMIKNGLDWYIDMQETSKYYYGGFNYDFLW